MAVQSLRTRLSHKDLEALTQPGNEDARAEAARKICARIGAIALADDERAQAEQILRFLARDAAEIVRRALATTLRNSPKLPRDVALKLAHDVATVALPILERSPMLSDKDLAEIIAAGDNSRQIAIAGRPNISQQLSRFVVAKAGRDAVARIVGNDGAQLDEAGLGMAINRFPRDNGIAETMAHRSTLPIGIAEKLVHLIAGAAFDHLVNHHELPPQLAIELASGARERATLDLAAQAGLAGDMQRFVQQLALNGRLTPSLVIRGALMGHMRFLEWALAELAGVPHHKTWLMVHDAGALGLRAIFERSGLPTRLFPAIRTAVDIFHVIESEGAGEDRDAFRRKMIERALTQFQALPREDADYLLERLDAIEIAGGGARRAA